MPASMTVPSSETSGTLKSFWVIVPAQIRREISQPPSMEPIMPTSTLRFKASGRCKTTPSSIPMMPPTISEKIVHFLRKDQDAI